MVKQGISFEDIMTTKPQDRPQQPIPSPADKSIQDVIAEQVVKSISVPASILSIRVSHLWDRRYRVNVYVGENNASSTVAKSYFVETNEEGKIVKSTPPMASKA